MKKIIFANFFFYLFILVQGQELLQRIPVNANVVAEIRTGQLFKLVPADSWNNTSFGKKLLEMSSADSANRARSLSDFGLSLEKNAYYFHAGDDSMQYNVVLIPLTSAEKFDALFKDKDFIRLDNNIRSKVEADSSGFLMWNNQQLIYLKGTFSESFFSDPEIINRYGLTNHFYPADTAVTIATDTLVTRKDEDIATPPPAMEPVQEQKPVIAHHPVRKKPNTAHPVKKGVTAKSKPGQKAPVGKKKKPVPPKEEMEQSDMSQNDQSASTDSVVLPPPPMSFEDPDYKIKKGLGIACSAARINKIFNQLPVASIAGNAQYMKGRDDQSVASLWIENPMNFYSSLVPSYFLYGRRSVNGLLNYNSSSGTRNFNSKLYLNEKQIRITTGAEMSNEMSAIQQKVLNRQLNKAFFNYINSDSTLAYMSWALDTRAYLDSFPSILENTYGALGVGPDREEYSLLSELVSFLLDEEAVSKLIKGDGMILFNGLYTQQTTYTDYVYDDNFKAKSVEKTKTDTLPRFLMMLSSEENNFERKLIRYGIRKQVVKDTAGFYEIAIPRSPFNLYFTNKDGIFFLTNAISDIQHIRDGSFVAKISKEEKKLLQDHNYNLFINPSRIAGELSTTELGAEGSLAQMVNTFRKMGNVHAAMQPWKANEINGELILDVPPGNENALRYVFSLFDGMVK